LNLNTISLTERDGVLLLSVWRPRGQTDEDEAGGPVIELETKSVSLDAPKASVEMAQFDDGCRWYLTVNFNAIAVASSGCVLTFKARYANSLKLVFGCEENARRLIAFLREEAN